MFRGGYIPLINISLVYLLANAEVFAVEWKHSNKYINKAKNEIELIDRKSQITSQKLVESVIWWWYFKQKFWYIF